VNRNVRIYLVWPRTEPDQPDIGFGSHRRLVAGAIIAALVPAVVVTALLLLDVARSAIIGVSIGGMLIELLLIFANLRYYRFYEIDSTASPLCTLSVQPPQAVSGRLPITRRRFLTLQEN
jgi:hypothetical protein